MNNNAMNSKSKEDSDKKKINITMTFTYSVNVTETFVFSVTEQDVSIYKGNKSSNKEPWLRGDHNEFK